MSFITESKKAYKQVKENHVAIAMGNMLDDEGSMILNQLEELERGINMLRDYVGKDYEKQLPAWVQSKVTLATDYISTVGNYLSSKNEKATEESIKESFSLEENTFEKIYQMQQDGKSTEDIAKELKLNPALVKKVLGENTIISEGLSDTQISQLKKEYEPLKGKTITTSQYQQLKNILFKLQDGDLEKLQKQNIPFASTGAGSILRARKSPVKITNVKVPGLEGMAEENQYVAVHVKKGKTSVTANSSYEAAKKASEKFGLNDTTGITVMLAKKDGEDVIHKATEEVEVTEEKIPQDYLDYLRTIVYKKVDFYEIPPKHIIQHWKDEPNKDRFKGKIIDYKEEVDLQEKPSRKKHVVFKVGDKLVAKDFRGYNDDEIAKSIDDFLKQNSKSIVVQQSPIQSVTEEPKNPYAIGMAAAMKATGDTPPLKKSTITKAHKIADKVKEEEVEIEENISQVTTKKNGADTDIFYKGKHIGYFHKITSQYGEGKIGNYFVYHDNENDPEDFTQSDEVSSEAQAKKIAYDSAKFNGLIEEKQAYGGKATDPEHQANYKATDEMRSIKAKRQQLEKELRALNKDDPSYKEKSAQKRKEIETQRELMARKQKEVYGSFDPSIEEVNKTNPKSDEKRTIDMTDGSAHVRFPKDDTKAMEFYKSKGYKVTTKYEETELEEACWTGYKKVGMKKKGDRMVPNCVPEGYVTESGDIVEFVELDEGQFKQIDIRKGDLKLARDKKQALKDKYNAIMANQATGDENSIADQIQKLDMSIKKQEQELIDIIKKQRETKKEEVEIKESHFPVNTQVLYKGQKAQIIQLKEPQIGNYYIVKLDSGENVEANYNELKLVENKINEGARALVEAIAALQKKADKSGMPYSILKQVYDRGMAAWKGGHRPGAGQHQWAFARVNSFVTKSSGTWGGADSDLAKKVKGKE